MVNENFSGFCAFKNLHLQTIFWRLCVWPKGKFLSIPFSLERRRFCRTWLSWLRQPHQTHEQSPLIHLFPSLIGCLLRRFQCLRLAVKLFTQAPFDLLGLSNLIYNLHCFGCFHCSCGPRYTHCLYAPRLATSSLLRLRCSVDLQAFASAI